MLKIVNLACKVEGIPEEWTKSIIVATPKKGHQSECTNYRTLLLMNHLLKTVFMIVIKRLKAWVEKFLAESRQASEKTGALYNKYNC